MNESGAYRRRPEPPQTPNHDTRMQRTPEGDAGWTLAKHVATRVIQSPKAQAGISLWIIGLLFMLVLPGLYQITPEVQKQYEHKLVEAANLPAYHDALEEYLAAQSYADEAKVWFWRWREPYASQVHERQPVADEWKIEVDKQEALRESMLRDAKSEVGLWSDFGFSEVRANFWSAFDRGKVFAQQQTFYNMIFSVLSGRDEELVSTILHWVFTAVVNFTTGLVGAFFYFVVTIGSVISSYQPDPVSFLLFFLLAIVGAAAVIATYLMLIYGGVAGGVYVVGQVAVRQALEQERQGQRLHYRR